MRLLTPVLTVAHLKLYRETRRRRIVTAAVICAAAFLAVYTAGLFFVHREQIRAATPFAQQQIVMAFLAVAGCMASTSCRFCSPPAAGRYALGEIDSGVKHTIASKPVRRADIVIGKWLGHAVVVTGYVLGLSLGVMLSMRVVVGPMPCGRWKRCR